MVYSTDGHIPLKIIDPKIVVLYTVPKTDTGFQNGQYTHEFPDSTWEIIKSQTELRLMLSDNDMTEFEIIPENIALLKVPQK